MQIRKSIAIDNSWFQSMWNNKNSYIKSVWWPFERLWYVDRSQRHLVTRVKTFDAGPMATRALCNQKACRRSHHFAQAVTLVRIPMWRCTWNFQLQVYCLPPNKCVSICIDSSTWHNAVTTQSDVLCQWHSMNTFNTLFRLETFLGLNCFNGADIFFFSVELHDRMHRLLCTYCVQFNVAAQSLNAWSARDFCEYSLSK